MVLPQTPNLSHPLQEAFQGPGGYDLSSVLPDTHFAVVASQDSGTFGWVLLLKSRVGQS